MLGISAQKIDLPFGTHFVGPILLAFSELLRVLCILTFEKSRAFKGEAKKIYLIDLLKDSCLYNGCSFAGIYYASFHKVLDEISSFTSYFLMIQKRYSIRIFII